MLTMKKIFLFILMLILSQNTYAQVLAPASGRNLDVNSIVPADVLSRSKLLMSELQLIRIEMGKPDIRYKSVQVKNSAPREVYYQALALFNKSNRLSFEKTGFSVKTPTLVDSTSIRPFHVWQMVDYALQSVLKVKKALNIKENSPEIIQDINTKPDDVFSSMLDANRVINSLLSRRFEPSDVYQQVTVSIYTMAQLLSTFQGIQRIPYEPKLERFKTPNDVYNKLLQCYELLGDISTLSGHEFLEFTNIDDTSLNKAPSDVYDLSALLVADIKYLHQFRKGAKENQKAYFPGYKTPSHVYQRAEILYEQLRLLQKVVKKNKNWLKK